MQFISKFIDMDKSYGADPHYPKSIVCRSINQQTMVFPSQRIQQDPNGENPRL